MVKLERLGMSNLSRRKFLKKSAIGLGAGFLAFNNLGFAKSNSSQELPNILWIVSEDNSASYLGCYGNKQATTPNIDKLASEGILYENAFANAPVCAPMRNSIITGNFASTLGCHNMRSEYQIPDKFKFFPQYLRKAGYYCTNNAKEDYNTIKPDNVWHESSHNAHYKNRKPGQPFFAIFNTNLSHEHKIHFGNLIPKDKLQHDPDEIEIAPYHPDLPEIRHCYANYYDYISRMDARVGEVLQELEENGLAEDTIVFYYSDHGGVLPRSKRFIFESGTKIPLIVKFPDKYKHLAPGKPGSKEERLVSLLDLAPTLLSLANQEIPEQFAGHAFLGKKKSPDPDYVHFIRQRMDERYDMMRAVRDKKFRYIRNYMPHRKYCQHIWYLWRSSSTRAWEKAFKDGKCNDIQSRFWGYKAPEELYDIENDPHNVNNLANKPAYRKTLKRMRKENQKWVREQRDAGFIPESMMVELAADSTIYEMKSSRNFPFEKIVSTAEKATLKNPGLMPDIIRKLNDGHPAVRYWAATGCAIMPNQASSAVAKLKQLLKDPFGDVRVAAAEALVKIDSNKMEALQTLIEEMKSDKSKVRLRALNTLQALGEDSQPVLKDIMKLVPWKWSHKVDGYFKKAHADLIKTLKPGWEDYIIW